MLSQRLETEYRRLVIETLTQSAEPIHPDLLPEFLERFTERVYCLYWDSGGPGAGAGTVEAHRLGRWYLTSDADFGWDGPFETLADAVGTVFVTGATKEIWCEEWTAEEIIARMELCGPPAVITINGTEWPFERLEHVHQRLKND